MAFPKKGVPGYMFGLMLLLPSAVLMVACWLCPCMWLWKKWRGGSVRSEGVTRVRQNVSVEFPIPEQVVGFVIGRKGSSVKQVEAESGARVHFKDQQGTTDKVVVISGRASCVQAAQELIQQAVDEKLTTSKNQQMLTLTIPQRAVGRIIGRQGANIRSIQRESGAKVTMIDGSRSDSVRTCEVIGTSEQLARAVALIQEMVAQCEVRHSAPPRPRECTDFPMEILPLELPRTTEYMPVFVSSIDGTGGVWVQPIEEEDPVHLESLVENMTQYYSDIKDGCHGEVRVGGIYASPFDHDSSWYRVQVTSVSGDECELLYIDYGDYGTMDKNKLMELRPEYYTLKSQSVRCQLDSIIPTGGVWSEAALQCLEETTHSAAWKVLMLRVLSRERSPTVQIIDTSMEKDVDVADRIVSSGHAHWADPHPPYPHSLRYHRDGNHGFLAPSSHVTLPNESENISIYVLSVQTPELLFLQPLGHELSLSQLCERINTVYSESPQETLTSVEQGQLVAACFPNDDQWYRAQVISFNPSDSSALLRYLDYGLVFCLPLQHVRPLRPVFCDEVFYAVPCALADIQPTGIVGWSDEGCQFVRDATKPGDWQVMSANVTGCYSDKDGHSLSTITLRSSDESVSVNSGLVTAGLAEFKSRLSPEGREECGAEGVRQRNVKFQWTGANDVSIAGSFTDWKEVKLKRRDTGEFETDVDIPQGTHEYKFLVDGAWQHDQSQPTTFNSYGTLNNMLNASEL